MEEKDILLYGGFGKSIDRAVVKDAEAPVIKITPSTTAATNKPVTLKAEFSDNNQIVLKQYRLNGGAWQDYTKDITISSNMKVDFRAQDIAGNITEKSYSVSNIDNVAPEKPVAKADITSPTNGKVTVTAVFSKDSAKMQYSLDGKNWSGYTGGIVFSANGNVYFRGIDAAGNISQVTTYAVKNISAVISQSLVNLYQDKKLISAGTTLTGKNINAGGEMHVSQGGIASNTTLVNQGSMILSSGGTAVGTVINSKGALHVYSGAAASKTTVNQSGYFGVGKGAATYDTTLGYAGKLTVWNGGKVYRNTLNQYGTLILSSGALADSSVINSQGGLHVYSGAVASNTTVKLGGFLGVGKGAKTYNTVLDYAGKLTVWGGGVVNHNNIGTYGTLILSSGAVADKSGINAKGALHVYSGAVASYTTVKQDGFFGVGKGAKAQGTLIDKYGKLTVWGGGVVNDTRIRSFGSLILSSGAVASKTQIHSKGGLHIYSGAVASNTVVSSGANLGVGKGGKLVGAQVDYGAMVTFYKDSFIAANNTFAGTVNFNAGMKNTQGVNISIDISSRKSSDGSVINNIANVSGAALGIKFSSSQAAGRYKLAGGAGKFSGNISICSGGSCYGSLSVGKSLSAAGKKFTLGRSGETLFVDVANTASLAYGDTASFLTSSSSLLDAAKLY